MTDFALYRAVEAVGGRIRSAFRGDDGVLRAIVELQSPVANVFVAEVNRVRSPLVEMATSTVAYVGIPEKFEEVALNRLAIILYAEVQLDEKRGAVPETLLNPNLLWDGDSIIYGARHGFIRTPTAAEKIDIYAVVRPEIRERVQQALTGYVAFVCDCHPTTAEPTAAAV